MRLDELLDISFLQEMIAGGYVRKQFHPDEPLAILNYSEKAAFEAAWNDVTRACRGLIYNTETIDIIARPFPKFFNDSQLDPSWITARLDESVTVTDKMDGSLGILYRMPSTGGLAIATRGSFTSHQAEHATRVLHERYADFDPGPGLTHLFEIIYPQNRIVLNYYGMDDLVLLGGVSDHGAVWGPTIGLTTGWTGPRTHVFEARTLRDALALPPRQNAEGVVVRFLESGDMVKIKQEDYIALHRVITGMSERRVWELLGQGMTIDQIKAPLPEEFWPWVDAVALDLMSQADNILLSVWEEFLWIVGTLPTGFSRKEFAAAVKDNPNRGWMFKFLDKEPVRPLVWKTLKPDAAFMGSDLGEDA